MSVEIVNVLKTGDEFSIRPVQNRPLPPIREKSPEEVARKLADHFEAAIREGQKSWMTAETILVVEMPGGKTAEIAFEKPAALNA